jgi:hypothetical protein
MLRLMPVYEVAEQAPPVVFHPRESASFRRTRIQKLRFRKKTTLARSASFEVALFSRGAAAEGSRGRKPPELEQKTIP